jgi:hypothetical protein
VDHNDRPAHPLVTCGDAVFEARCQAETGDWIVLMGRLSDLYSGGLRIHTTAWPIDAQHDGGSDALQRGILGLTQEQLLDTDDDGVADACDSLGSE